jgi:hypothetical protein
LSEIAGRYHIFYGGMAVDILDNAMPIQFHTSMARRINFDARAPKSLTQLRKVLLVGGVQGLGEPGVPAFPVDLKD